jgi:hypothetical protein
LLFCDFGSYGVLAFGFVAEVDASAVGRQRGNLSNRNCYESAGIL